MSWRIWLPSRKPFRNPWEISLAVLQFSLQRQLQHVGNNFRVVFYLKSIRAQKCLGRTKEECKNHLKLLLPALYLKVLPSYRFSSGFRLTPKCTSVNPRIFPVNLPIDRMPAPSIQANLQLILSPNRGEWSSIICMLRYPYCWGFLNTLTWTSDD